MRKAVGWSKDLKTGLWGFKYKYSKFSNKINGNKIRQKKVISKLLGFVGKLFRKI